MDLYGIGDHGGGPTRAILDEGFHWAAPSQPGARRRRSTSSAPRRPTSPAVEKQIAPDSPVWNYQSIAKGYTPPPAVPGKVAIPTWKSELYFEYHRGVMTTQANHKRNMRDAEEEVLNAEKWASLAWLDGPKYPADELTEDWKKVLFNQFHDLAAGSGIGVIYKDAQKDYDLVRLSTNEIDGGRAADGGRQHVNTAGAGIPVVVYNPLGWEALGYGNGQRAGSDGSRRVCLDGKRKEPGRLIRPAPRQEDSETGVARLRFSGVTVPALDINSSTFTRLPTTPKGDTEPQCQVLMRRSQSGMPISI